MNERVKFIAGCVQHEETFAALCEAAGRAGGVAALSIARGRRCPLAVRRRRSEFRECGELANVSGLVTFAGQRTADSDPRTATHIPAAGFALNTPT
jgi:hypothetical protein